jgi:2-polyprenyl-3-methyl-5-hydroxy-6-metoxy-1,4-benzoquinol methylase
MQIDLIATLEELRQQAAIDPQVRAALEAAMPAPDPYLLGLKDAQLSGWFRDATNELLPGFPVTSDTVVLDVGCGDGGIATFCADRRAHIILADIDKAKVEQAANRMANTAARAVDVYVTDGDPLPLSDGTADRIICTEVLEHVDEPSAFMKELVRVGKPDALYLLAVPDPVSENMQKHLGPPAYFAKPNHIRIFEREAFADLVKSAGLTVEKRYYYGFFWSIWWLLVWQCGLKDMGSPRHPILDNWTRTWAAILESKDGLRIKRVFDRFMPKSQAIIARKPTNK